MSAYSSVLGVLLLLLHLWGTHSFPTSNACPVPCLCQRGPLLNCSLLGLTKVPSHIPATAISLNISHNALHSLHPLSSGHVRLKGLLHLWVGSNALDSLSLSLSGSRTLSSGEGECMSWVPDLQMLSAERNHLKHLPKGLGCVKALQMVQLSYNYISEIGPADLTYCTHLKELHLQYNRIRSIHPHAFTHLKELQVLDVSHNLLATVPIPAYQSLHNLNALVDVSFNSWKCDCNLQTLRRWIGFDSEVGKGSWQVVCASPPHHAGKNLLHLEDSDLTCPTHEYSTSGHYHNMIVDEGTQILMSCSNDSQDFMQVHWWTPHGQVTENQPELLIKDIAEDHAGLYICVSGFQGEHISVFDLHVYKKGKDSRPRREAPSILDERTGQNNKNVQRNDPFVRQATHSQSEFALAVSLSVIITFIVAFILGVFLRPLLEKLWKRIRSKRHSTTSPAHSGTSSAEPQPYVNEGFSYADDQEQDERVGSRVTFGGATELGAQGSNVPYYVTVEDVQADGSSESNTEVEVTYENIQKKESSITDRRQQALGGNNHRGRTDSISSNSSQEDEANAVVLNGVKLASSSTEKRANAQNTKVTDFEPIPEVDDITQLNRRSSSSASSCSRGSQKINFSSEIKESTEQSVDSPSVTVSVNETNTKTKIPGFTTEPFSDWPKRLTEQNVDDLDPELWNESGESFSFNDESERSSIRDGSNSPLGHKLKDDDTWRQDKAISPSEKINLDSQVARFDQAFGKEVLVDDVKQFERSETLSSSSSESGESQGGPNNYTINSEILNVSDPENTVTLNRYSTLEDVTGKSQTGTLADILIKQETIILDPSDIHLTFPRRDSFDEKMLIDEPQRISDDENNLTVKTSGNKPLIDHRNRYDSSSSGSHEVFPQYQVHPVYRKNQNTLNRDYDSDRSSTNSSSEDEEQLTEYPRRLEIKTVPEIKTESITPNKNTNTVLNIDFDNSSSSTDVSEKRRSKGLMGLKELSARLFNRHENEKNVQPQVQTGSTTSSDVGGSGGFLDLSFNRQPNRRSSLSSSSEEDNISTKQEKSIIFGQSLSLKPLPKVKRYLRFSYSDPLPQVQLPSPPPNTGLVKPNLIATTEPRRSSSSSEDEVKQTIEGANFFGQVDLSSDGLPKVKRHIAFSHTKPFSTTQPLNKASILPAVVATPGSRRSSTSSEDDIKQDEIKIKRDVVPEAAVEKSSSTSVKSDSYFTQTEISPDRILKVKRYLQFKQSKLHSPALSSAAPSAKEDVMMKIKRSSTSSEDDVEMTTDEENFFQKIGLPFVGVSKVNRYITFKPSSPTLPVSSPSIKIENTVLPVVLPTTSLNTLQVTSDVKTKTESRRLSTSSEDDVTPTSGEDDFFGQIGASVGKLPKVKRYINFKQPQRHSPTFSIVDPSTTIISAERVSISGVDKETRRSSSSSEDDVKPHTNENTSTGEIGESPDKIPKVKRYIKFTKSEPFSLAPIPFPRSSTIKPIKATETELKGSSTVLDEDVRSDTRENKTESRRLSTSSEDDVPLTPGEDNFFGQIGASVGKVPKVKRYINFKQTQRHSPTSSVVAQKTTILSAERVSISGVAKERSSSSSSEDDVKQSTNVNIMEEKVESPYKLPQIKRYIKFTQSELHPSAPSPFPQSSTIKSIQMTETELRKSSTVADNVQPATRVNKAESRRLSTSSEDDVTLTDEKGNFFGQIGASVGKVPKVKRYINFKQPQRHSPTSSIVAPSTTILSPEKVSISGVVRETRRSSSSSEDDVKPYTNDNIIEGKVESLDKIPKVKRYIKFTQSELHPLAPSPFPQLSTIKSIQMTETELTKANTAADNVQPATRVNKTESRRLSTSSEDDVTPTAEENNFFGQIGTSLHKVPKVKRYIHFTQPERHSPVQTTVLPAERVSMSGLAKETRRSSSSSEDDVKKHTNNVIFLGETGVSLDKTSKIKRYIKFTTPEPFSSTLSQSKSNLATQQPSLISNKQGVNPVVEIESSSSSENDQSTIDENVSYRQTGTSFSHIPKVKRYVEFKQHEHRLPVEPSAIDVKLSSARDASFGQSDILFDNLSRPNRSLHLNMTNPPYPNRLSPTSVQRDGIPKAKANRETRWSSSSSEDSSLSSDRKNVPGHLVMDVALLKDEPPAVPQTPPPPLEQEDAREYLRENTEVRQRQERRRLFQQKRKAMDGFSITSLSSMSQEGHKQDSSSLVDYGGATSFHTEHTYSNVPTGHTVTSRRMMEAEVPSLQGLKTKNISTHRSKSPVHLTTEKKYKEFLI